MNDTTNNNKPVTQGSTFRGVLWVLAARQGERLLGLLSITILARVLSPADFGLVGMAGSVVALVEVISRFGFDWALVRLQNPTRQHYDTAWTLRVISGLVVCTVLLIAAWPAALIFHRPAVAWLVIAMGANSFIGAFENIWMAEYRRQTRFDPEFNVRMGAKVAGFIVGVGYAIVTHSYWALVVGVTASSLATVALSYVLHPGRPRWDFSQRADLLHFSIWLLIGNVTETLRARFADMWLGRALGASSVGYFSIAQEISALASTELAAPINRVVFANYSQLGNDVDKLRNEYLRVSTAIWLIGFPAAVGIWTCATQIVAVLLGKQWIDAVAVLQILAIAGLLGIVAANTQYVYWALGRTRFVATLSIVGSICFILFTAFFGVRWGLTGVAWGQVAAASIAVAINMSVLFRRLRLGFFEFARVNYRVVVASTLMGICVSAVGHWWDTRLGAVPLVELGVMVATGVVVYAAALFGLWWLTGRSAGTEAEIFALLRRRFATAPR